MTNKESIIKLCNKIEELEGVIKYYEKRVQEWENQNNDLKLELLEIKEKMRGVNLNAYQKGLSLDEYYKLLDYVDELEQLTIPDVVGQSEQLLAFAKWIQENGNHITPEKQVRYYEIDSQ